MTVGVGEGIGTLVVAGMTSTYRGYTLGFGASLLEVVADLISPSDSVPDSTCCPGA